MTPLVAGLYVLPDGPYAGLPGVDVWDEKRDARSYPGPFPVVAHPPCARWGRYWDGGPSAKVRRELGDDGGCFAAALASVRKWGGILEHPEASHAWKRFGLRLPEWEGGWLPADDLGGYTCCVSQGHYGHDARKMTWLYLFGLPFDELPALKWGPSVDKVRLECGFRSAAERKEGMRDRRKNGIVENRLGHKARLITPNAFRDLLIGIAAKCDPSRADLLQLSLLEVT